MKSSPGRLFLCPMRYLLFDEPSQQAGLRPFTFTRPVAALRVGILTVAEKWASWLGVGGEFLTHLPLWRLPLLPHVPRWAINGGLCPDHDVVDALQRLAPGQALMQNGTLLAAQLLPAQEPNSATALLAMPWHEVPYARPVTLLRRGYDIFRYNGAQIRADFERVTAGRLSAPLADFATTVYAPEQVFLEPGARVRAAVLNAENGPIYLGPNADVQEGALVRGPFALGADSVIGMGAKIRGDTTVGPGCKVSGEVSNSVVMGFSNKGHEGYLGNSVVGEWCNLGADTNTSNLKNNYASVRLYHYDTKQFEPTGLQFCGLIMGDHAKAGINTMFNTGTVVGVGANVFGADFPPKFVPDFSWGGRHDRRWELEKFLDTERRVMARRQCALSAPYEALLRALYAQATQGGEA